MAHVELILRREKSEEVKTELFLLVLPSIRLERQNDESWCCSVLHQLSESIKIVLLRCILFIA